jgi:hypothetical protein
MRIEDEENRSFLCSLLVWSEVPAFHLTSFFESRGLRLSGVKAQLELSPEFSLHSKQRPFLLFPG